MPIFSPSSQEGHSASRSLLSRLSVPLRPAATRNIHDFHIRLNEPHRDYAAGDNVSGAVVLIITKTLRITHMVIALHGYVRVTTADRLEDEDVVRPVGDSGPRYHGKGYLTLFQEEKALGEEGSLKGPGQFEFPFSMTFPGSAEKRLPSSIDFEMGRITYDLIATMTRPTTISPTMQCSRKLNVVERMDVGKLRPPIVDTKWLDPVKTRRKRPERVERQQQVHRESTEPLSDADSTRRSVLSEDATQEQLPLPVRPNTNTEHVDERSTFSADSNISETTGTFLTTDGANNSAVLSNMSAAKRQELEEQTISVSALLHKAGILPGEQISVTIAVQHNKKMKSVHGIIATLYRQCRIDPTPPSDSFLDLTKDDMRRLAKDDYYPRSKSGLRGLHLSSSASVKIWRKDLCQAVAPLFIDPQTLSAEVTVTLRLPEDSFPTISHVPGDMINFKYRIEIIIDLGGKLDSQLRSTNGPSRSHTMNSASSSTHMWSPNIINTSPIKDQSGLFRYQGLEVVVGTTDSTRGHVHASNMFNQPNGSSASQTWGDTSWTANDHNGSTNGAVRPQPQSQPLHANGYFPSTAEADAISPGMDTSRPTHAPAYVPRPSAPDLSQMSDKERIRYHEQMLLPSQPPQHPTSESEAGPSGSAPPEDALSPPAPAAAATTLPSVPPASAPGMADVSPVAPHVPYPSQQHSEASAPTMEQLSSLGATTDDKQELQRQRLLAEASAPPEFPEDCVASSSRVASGPSAPEEPEVGPSAPVLAEEDDYHTIAGPSTAPAMNGGEPLPKYEQ